MSEPNSIIINEVEYVRADTPADTKGDIKIAVLDRGFVYIGHCDLDENWLIITSAKNIRNWGTSKGLGELVNGPLKDTVLDPAGTVRVPMRALIHLIDVSQSKWKL